MKFFLFVFLIFTSLFAQKTIEPLIYVTTNDINLSHVVAGVTQDRKIATIQENKYTYKIKASDLLAMLKRLGYTNYKTQSRYIRFVKESPVDTSKIEAQIEQFYRSHYPDIQIERIDVFPRGFLESLPASYNVSIDPRSSLSNEGILYIDTLDRKKIFFDYAVTARLNIYTTKTALSRDTPLSVLNLANQTVYLEDFRDKPFILQPDATYQAKFNLKQGVVVTMRDVEPLTLVHKGTKISVKMLNKTMDIQFSAEALQDGKLNDIITVLNSNDKKIRVKVVGKNQAEMR
jgi:flagella basal body P-ring formation protein FlgA